MRDKVTEMHGLFILLSIVCLVKSDIDEGTAEGSYTVITPPAHFLQRQKPECVSSCSGMRDGNYVSCKGCQFFITCSNGFIFSDQSCSWFGGLFWNPRLGLCDWNPNSCHSEKEDERAVEVKPKRRRLDCVEDCDDLPDGDYQSCRGCNAYLTCADGFMYDDRLCPGALVWDDSRKYCDWFSHTCKRGDKPYYESDDDSSSYPNTRTSTVSKIIKLKRRGEDFLQKKVELTPLQRLLLRGPV